MTKLISHNNSTDPLMNNDRNSVVVNIALSQGAEQSPSVKI